MQVKALMIRTGFTTFTFTFEVDGDQVTLLRLSDWSAASTPRYKVFLTSPSQLSR